MIKTNLSNSSIQSSSLFIQSIPHIVIVKQQDQGRNAEDEPSQPKQNIILAPRNPCSAHLLQLDQRDVEGHSGESIKVEPSEDTYDQVFVEDC